MKIPMTVNGMNELRRELERLRSVERPRLAKLIGEARALGDLSENAEYHAAREAQGIVEAKIRDIESKIANANVIDISKIACDDLVVFGATVEVVNLDNDKLDRYQLVGDDEADAELGKISINAPIARAIVGKRCGDVVTVTTPAGVLELEIAKVEYLA